MSRQTGFKFLLYVAGHSQNSTRAIANLNMLCQTYLADRHQIEVVDVFKEPKRALADGVLMTPMLVKLAPSPVSRIVGSLSNAKTVLESLGLESNQFGEVALAQQALRPESATP
jgi:circadian clock protein KaiB